MPGVHQHSLIVSRSSAYRLSLTNDVCLLTMLILSRYLQNKQASTQLAENVILSLHVVTDNMIGGVLSVHQICVLIIRRHTGGFTGLHMRM